MQAPCDPRVLNPAYSLPALDPEELRYNEICRKSNGAFYCALCWKHPRDEWHVKNHIQSKEHVKRILNREYEADPLACVPSPHLEFTAIVDGWATCSICNKRMDEKHWNSEKHIRYLNYYLGQQNALGNVGPVSLPPLDTQLPLPQPPPPPEPPSLGCGIAAGGFVTAAVRSSVAASNTTSMTSCAQTLRGAQGDYMPAASDAYGRPFQVCAMSVCTQPGTSMAYPVACQPLPRASAPLFRDVFPLQESASRHDHQHPWGSRGPHSEVLNDDEWNQILQEFDARYAGDWWPIDTEWEFFDV